VDLLYSKSTTNRFVVDLLYSKSTTNLRLIAQMEFELYTATHLGVGPTLFKKGDGPL